MDSSFFSAPKGRFSLGQLHVLGPQLLGRLRGEIGAQQISALAQLAPLFAIFLHLPDQANATGRIPQVELGSEQRAVALFKMTLQFRPVRQDAVQVAVKTRVVDLAFFDLQMIVQRGRWIPALLDGQFAARRTETVDRRHRRYPRPGNIGPLAIDVLFEEIIQFKPLPQLQSEKSGTEPTRPFQANLVHNYPRRIVIGRHLMQRKQFQLTRFLSLVEHLNRLQPARLCRTVQLAQIADRPLTRTIRRAYRFPQ